MSGRVLGGGVITGAIIVGRLLLGSVVFYVWRWRRVPVA
jgi:hypothetical protein